MKFEMNPNSELVQSVVIGPNVANVPDNLIEQGKQFQQIMMMYTGAIREVKTKLEVLNDELSVRNQRNPIELIKSRVKKPRSIVEKLQRRNLPISIESIMTNLDDVAGIRVICSFIDDIYAVANMLVSQDDVTIVAIKDYIKNPKPNGYRSYHLILEVPVFFSDQKRYMRVEVQIRTMAMDFWASVDHQLKYKKDIGEAAAEISDELCRCAKVIAETDRTMLEIRRKIEAQGVVVKK